MTYKFSQVSLDNLKGVHPALVMLCQNVIGISQIDFRVVDGLRTLAQQKVNIAKGVSQTLNSLHLKQKDGYGHAIDFVVWRGGPDWFAIKDFKIIGSLFKQQAKIQKLNLTYGGDWKTLKDYGHIQLNL
jgi:peptidoglycan L-alanyl-D-glutamate endopeptidase CwlK